MNIFPICFHKILAIYSPNAPNLMWHFKCHQTCHQPCHQTPLVNAWVRSPRANTATFSKYFEPLPTPRIEILYSPLCLRVNDHGYMIRGGNSLGRPIIIHLEINYLM